VIAGDGGFTAATDAKFTIRPVYHVVE